MSIFIPGWKPEFYENAINQRTFGGFPDYAKPRFATADIKLPDGFQGFSLSRFRLYPYNQLQIGSCFSNATAQLMQILTVASNYAGSNWQTPQLSRRMIWYQGRKLDGGLNGPDGGSISNAMLAISNKSGYGVGCCREESLPYSENSRIMDQTPPKSAFDEAADNFVTDIAQVSTVEEWQNHIFNGHSVDIGIWWAYNWDEDDGKGFVTYIGNGVYGHALCIIGWLVLNNVLYWQIENSHGPIYHPLQPDTAKLVLGYQPAAPDKTYDFWVPDTLVRKVMSYGNAESVTAAGIDGFKERDLTAQDFYLI